MRITITLTKAQQAHLALLKQRHPFCGGSTLLKHVIDEGFDRITAKRGLTAGEALRQLEQGQAERFAAVLAAPVKAEALKQHADSYTAWANAGGPNECAHGFAKGIPCC